MALTRDDRLLTSRQSLCEALRTTSVTLVLGADAVLVDIDRGDSAPVTIPLYEAVAEDLLASYKLTLPDRQASNAGSSWLLHQAVAHVLTQGAAPSMEILKRSVASIVNSVSRRAVAAPLLDRLARLNVFDLVICLMPDDCMVEALQKAVGAGNVHVSAYAPQLHTGQPVDVPPARPGLARVFFPLGRSAAGSRLAIHEEDALEFLYNFQEEAVRRMPNLLAELRNRDLLLLGCNLPDWLARGFLRHANQMRLSSQDRKMEFFGADARDQGLNTFLSRFAPNASVFPWPPAEFVSELEGIVSDMQQSAALPPSTSRPATPPAIIARKSSAPTVFISYASEDREAARRLADALSELGFGDVWFDKQKLVAGDVWSDQIDRAIEQCDFFMPVLSQSANRRREGVFWEEWRKAVSRSLRINDAFLLPVGIDHVEPAHARYDHIFSGFTAGFRILELLHAPDGMLSAKGREQLQARWRQFVEGRS